MLDNDPKELKNSLLKLAPRIFRNTPVLFAYLFGSFAAGFVHPFSDIDIAVYMRDVSLKNSLDLELNLSLEFDEKLDCMGKSEVRLINNLPLMLKGKIVTEGTLIFSANEFARVDFETSVRMAYFDFLPVVRNYQMIYLESVKP